jgi:hypothetical protein
MLSVGETAGNRIAVRLSYYSENNGVHSILSNLSQSMSSMQIASEEPQSPPEVLVALPSKPSFVLPPPDSDEWEPFVLPPAPSPVPQRSHVRSRGR